MKLSDIGVTPAKEKQFATKGIFTVEDLVSYLPNRYNDYSQITGILQPEFVSCFRATVDRIERKYGGKQPFLSGKVTTQDWSGYRSVFISWFNMNFLYDELCSHIGKEVLIVGKVQERNGYLVMTNPEKCGADIDLGIYPVYPQINKMSAKYLSDTIRSSITVVENHCEMLPPDVVKKYNLLPMSRALHFIHEPKNMEETVIGKQRSIPARQERAKIGMKWEGVKMVIGKRILVLGCSGSGKSTFSGKLRAITGLPLIHLDNIWWKPDRSHISRDEFDRKLDEILQENAWILDGDYSRTYEVRFKACDTLIFLDYPIEECMKGISERVGKKREDIPWIEDTIDPELVELVQGYAENNRPAILSLMGKYPDKQKLTFRSRAEADDWLREFAERRNAPSFEKNC